MRGVRADGAASSTRARGESFRAVLGVVAALAALLGLVSTRVVGSARAEGPPLALTQPAWNIELVGQFGGRAAAVAVDQRHAYLGVGPRLVALDVSDPSQPLPVGQTAPLPGRVVGIAAGGGYAYLAAAHGGLRVVDVSDPGQPREVGALDTAGQMVNAVALADGYAFAARSAMTEPPAGAAAAGGGLSVVDVRNPAAPVEVGRYESVVGASGVAVAGGYAYVALGPRGLRILDVRDPTRPVEVGAYQPAGQIARVVVRGGLAYATWRGSSAGGGANDGGLRVIDVSDPTGPREVGVRAVGGLVQGLAVEGTVAYLTRFSGLYVLDVADPARPFVRAFRFDEAAGEARDVAVRGSHAFVAASGGLRVEDASHPDGLSAAGGYATAFGTLPGGKLHVAMEGPRRIVYAVGRIPTGSPHGGPEVAPASLPPAEAGLVLFDASDPSSLVPVGYYRAAGPVAVAGRFAYVAAADGFHVVDVGDPALPVRAGFLPSGAPAGAPAASGAAFPQSAHAAVAVAERDGRTYAYVGSTQLAIFDVTDPATPVRVGGYRTGGAPAAAGGVLFVAGGAPGLFALDVSDPANVREVGFYNTSNATGLVLSGRYAFVPDWGRLHVVDVDSPAAPVEVGLFAGGGFGAAVPVPAPFPGDAGIAGTRYVYLASHGKGLQVVDFSNPAGPAEVGFFRTPSSAAAVAAAGDLAYVADDEGGVLVLRFTGWRPSPLVDASDRLPGDDWSLPAGHFYTQTRGNLPTGLGFAVTDDRVAPFWTEFQRAGGVAVLGYPVSRRYLCGDGGEGAARPDQICQTFQHGLLRWRWPADPAQPWRWDRGQRRWDAGRMDLLAVPEAQTKGAGLIPLLAVAPEDPASYASRTTNGASLTG